jgi:DGQHR domain-containing protein
VTESDFLMNRYGAVVDFGPCVVGKNLNVLSVRGYGRLDQLACVSDADVYDQVDNPTGTQRALNKKHAQECFEYAEAAAVQSAEQGPKAFPEILLNVRDPESIEVYDLRNPDQLLSITSFTDASELDSRMYGLRVPLRNVMLPKSNRDPKISRVDGNHRLAGTDAKLIELLTSDETELELEFADVPFAFFIGLSTLEEGSLFKDINAEHQGMETAHLANLTASLHTPEEMKNDPELLPLWMAMELSSPGRAFDGIVFRGGSKKGLKAAGMRPMLKISSLSAAIKHQLNFAPAASSGFAERPDGLLQIVGHFWSAVQAVFPEAWSNKREYILMNTIGLNGFAEFGGQLIDQCVKEGDVGVEHFKLHLEPLRDRVSLKRADFMGIAGGGGAKEVARRLNKAVTPDAVNIQRVMRQLNQDKTVDEKLGLDG